MKYRDYERVIDLELTKKRKWSKKIENLESLVKSYVVAKNRELENDCSFLDNFVKRLKAENDNKKINRSIEGLIKKCENVRLNSYCMSRGIIYAERKGVKEELKNVEKIFFGQERFRYLKYEKRLELIEEIIKSTPIENPEEALFLSDLAYRMEQRRYFAKKIEKDDGLKKMFKDVVKKIDKKIRVFEKSAMKIGRRIRSLALTEYKKEEKVGSEIEKLADIVLRYKKSKASFKETMKIYRKINEKEPKGLIKRVVGKASSFFLYLEAKEYEREIVRLANKAVTVLKRCGLDDAAERLAKRGDFYFKMDEEILEDRVFDEIKGFAKRNIKKRKALKCIISLYERIKPRRVWEAAKDYVVGAVKRVGCSLGVF